MLSSKHSKVLATRHFRYMNKLQRRQMGIFDQRFCSYVCIQAMKAHLDLPHTSHNKQSHISSFTHKTIIATLYTITYKLQAQQHAAQQLVDKGMTDCLQSVSLTILPHSMKGNGCGKKVDRSTGCHTIHMQKKNNPQDARLSHYTRSFRQLSTIACGDCQFKFRYKQ